MHRIALGKQVCTSVTPDQTVIVKNFPAATEETKPTTRLRESLIALAENLDEDLQPASGDAETPQLDSALLAMADTLNAIDRNPPQGPSIDGEDGKHYLVIGRYRALDEAERVRSRHAALQTKVRMVLHDGTLLYQVTAGPFDRPAANELEAKLDKAGQKTRVALLCADGVTAGAVPCRRPSPETRPYTFGKLVHEVKFRTAVGRFTGR